MKLWVVFILFACFSAQSQETCGGPYYDAVGFEQAAGLKMSEAGQHYSEAYQEIAEDTPDMNLVCNNLDLAGQKFQEATAQFTTCFTLYKRAEAICEQQYKHLAVKGMNRCDKAANEGAQLVKTMNEVFAQHCS